MKKSKSDISNITDKKLEELKISYRDMKTLYERLNKPAGQIDSLPSSEDRETKIVEITGNYTSDPYICPCCEFSDKVNGIDKKLNVYPPSRFGLLITLQLLIGVLLFLYAYFFN